ncbi:MAG: aspartate carbamoyltransferase regulatory subunit [Lachnospiraceae bacterium]|nr:aspartate carbamoyltransferase regulatory subunit [Lachnospiraceae bacterium]MBO4559563.1 aspartate carbamoyltransferase regulatory subunit [Lachnospiraceae bacterium]MBR5732407.1 aspartate carbamoyltransferase regulatory subunit [Lachnospiraceae bacterium]
MNIDGITNGLVIDHIEAGKGMELYNALHLGDLECSVALIKNVVSHKMGKKDIIKVDEVIDVDLNVLGFIDPNITVNTIKNNEIVSKAHIELPQRVTNIIKCKNPRCITSVEQELPHVFKLTDPEKRIYRCVYCETKYEENK